MISFLGKVVNWIVWSSKNPENISLTLKFGIPSIALFLVWGHFGVTIDESIANDLVKAIIDFIVPLGQAITALGTAYGLLRKVFLTTPRT